eukprot:2653209-Rhodomonas_salina.1
MPAQADQASRQQSERGSRCSIRIVAKRCRLGGKKGPRRRRRCVDSGSAPVHCRKAWSRSAVRRLQTDRTQADRALVSRSGTDPQLAVRRRCLPSDGGGVGQGSRGRSFRNRSRPGQTSVLWSDVRDGSVNVGWRVGRRARGSLAAHDSVPRRLSRFDPQHVDAIKMLWTHSDAKGLTVRVGFLGVDALIKSTIESARSEGFVKTLMGRKRWMSDLISPNGSSTPPATCLGTDAIRLASDAWF